MLLRPIATILACLALTGAAAAATCQNTGNFSSWLSAFKKEAIAGGISKQTFAAADPDLVFDQSTLDLDHQQGVFNQSFLQFSDRMVNKFRQSRGQALIKKNKALFDRIEQQYGVPAPVIVAFWALESDFGANSGST